MDGAAEDSNWRYVSCSSAQARVHVFNAAAICSAKVEPKTVQGILRHAKIQTTLDLYTQEDGRSGEYLTTLGGRYGVGAVKLWVRLWVEVCGTTPGNLLK